MVSDIFCISNYNYNYCFTQYPKEEEYRKEQWENSPAVSINNLKIELNNYKNTR